MLFEPVLLGDERGHELDARLLLRLPQAARAPLLGVGPDPEASAREARTPALAGLAEPLGGDQDLAGRGVDPARGERDLALGLLSTEADALDAHGAAAALGRELGDRAGDDVLHPEHLADLGELRGARVGPIALSEVLLREHRVELLALDHPEGPVVD